MKLVLDMNLAPALAEQLSILGVHTVHWITVGSPTATDREIFDWARQFEHVIVTHDLDFPALLANAKTRKPSTILVRASDMAGHDLANLLANVALTHNEVLLQGAIITLDAVRMRVRVLPL